MIKKIAIVGGGTAGWLTANHLGHALLGTDTEITLIESPTIPTIGVGEGTVPSIRHSLQKFGIRETDFIRQCDVTFKQSIKFVNWLDKAKHGDNYYHHLFDHPYIFGEEITQQWLADGKQSRFAHEVSKQEICCEEKRAPKTISTPEFVGINGYAYHFDAKKFAAFLKEHAKTNFAVSYLQADITAVTTDVDGFITHLIDSDNNHLAYDFIIDCSGFSAAIIGEELKVGFIDRSNELLTDTAITLQVPTSKDDEIPPYTIATAHQAGWIWDIALTERRGVGLVFSAKHMSKEQAIKKLHHYLGNKFTHMQPRVIPMKVGRREKFWHKNCVAIGLSQGFVEPLEATAILLTDFSAALLAKRFPRTKDDIDHIAPNFNKHVAYVWDSTFDFIKLHYCISDRSDSLFWQDNRDPAGLSTKLKNNLARWQYFAPIQQDFSSKFDLFDLENYLYVLYGMNYLPRKEEVTQSVTTLSTKQLGLRDSRVKQLLNELPKHRALIEKIHQFGLQKD